jgi:hypothetical protein
VRRSPLRTAPLLTLLLAVGCGGPTDLYPLRVGADWTYRVTTGFAESVQTIKVTRRVPVAYTSGFELDGPMGISRLAWRGGTLYAEVLPNTRIYKPMPMLVAGDPKATERWTGMVEVMGSAQKAQEFLHQEPDSIELGSKKYEAIKATLNLKLPDKEVELETWYAPGIGPIRQEQRTNGKLDMKVELLGGP